MLEPAGSVLPVGHTGPGDTQMMGCSGMSAGMLWGIGLLWLLTTFVLVLSAAALAKYIFFGIRGAPADASERAVRAPSREGTPNE